MIYLLLKTEEIMKSFTLFQLHRRLLHDDCLGVGEPLNETGADGKGLIVRGIKLPSLKISVQIGLWLFFSVTSAS